MLRSLLVGLLATTTLVAAPVPKKTANKYQKLADETEWQFPEFNFGDALASELNGYRVKRLDEAGGVLIVVSNDKSEHLFDFGTHRNAPFLQRNGVLYHTEFSPNSTGCSVVAFDLIAKKQLWKTSLKGVGDVDHSKYFNAVRLEVLDDDTLRVFGKESSGRYVEIVSRGTGKTVGHKVFKEKE
jgi:hypothetical protein